MQQSVIQPMMSDPNRDYSTDEIQQAIAQYSKTAHLNLTITWDKFPNDTCEGWRIELLCGDDRRVGLLKPLFTVSRPCHILASFLCALSIGQWLIVIGFQERNNLKIVLNLVLFFTCAAGDICALSLFIMWKYESTIYPKKDQIMSPIDNGFKYTPLPDLKVLLLIAGDLAVGTICTGLLVASTRRTGPKVVHNYQQCIRQKRLKSNSAQKTIALETCYFLRVIR